MVINRHSECEQERRCMMVLAQKRFKADVLVFKCLQGTIAKTSRADGERVSHNYRTIGNKATFRVPRVRTEAAIKSFSFQGSSCFDKQPFCSNAYTTKSFPARLALAPFVLWPKLSPKIFTNHLSLH